MQFELMIDQDQNPAEWLIPAHISFSLVVSTHPLLYAINFTPVNYFSKVETLTLGDFWSGITRLIFTCHCSVSGQTSRWVVSLLLNAEKKQNSSAKKSSSSFMWRRFFLLYLWKAVAMRQRPDKKSSLLTSLCCLDSAFTSQAKTTTTKNMLFQRAACLWSCWFNPSQQGRGLD